MCIEALSASPTSWSMFDLASGATAICWRWIRLSAFKAEIENSSSVGLISYKEMGAEEVTSWANSV